MYSSCIKKNKGFTVVEMIVVVGIFSIVMTIAMGAIFTVISSNKSAQSLQLVMDNLNSALDTMSRNTRFGTDFTEISSVNSKPCSGFSFVPYNRETTSVDRIVYCFKKDEGSDEGSIYRVSNGQESRMTAPEVKLQDVTFYVQNKSGFQPKIFMLLKGYADVGGTQRDFNIQTLTSQRTLNLNI